MAYVESFKQLFSEYTCLKPVIIGGKRFIVTSEGWGWHWELFGTPGAGAVRVLETDGFLPFIKYWWPIAFYDAPWKAGDIYAKVFPETFPDKIIIFGTCGDGSGAFIAYFDVSTNTFSDRIVVSECKYLTDIVYANGYFYIVPHKPFEYDFANWIYRVAPENLFTPVNWVKVNMPIWRYRPYMEARITYFKNYVYVFRSNKGYYYDLLRWNLADDTFETILSEANPLKARELYYIFPYLRANDVRLVAVLPKVAGHFRVIHTTDGFNWSDGFTLNFIPANLFGELHCFALPFQDDTIMVSQTSDGTQNGYITLYDLWGNEIQKWTGIISHYSEAMMVVDGKRIVIGGESGSSAFNSIKTDLKILTLKEGVRWKPATSLTASVTVVY